MIPLGFMLKVWIQLSSPLHSHDCCILRFLYVCGFILHFLLSSVHLTMAYVHVLSRGRLFATPLTIKPGSSACGIVQARILEWVAISFSRGSSQPTDKLTSPALAGGFFTTEPPGKPSFNYAPVLIIILF